METNKLTKIIAGALIVGSLNGCKVYTSQKSPEKTERDGIPRYEIFEGHEKKQIKSDRHPRYELFQEHNKKDVGNLYNKEREPRYNPGRNQ